jgi:hypothetical protein
MRWVCYCRIWTMNAKKYMIRWIERRRSERDPFSCVCSSFLLLHVRLSADAFFQHMCDYQLMHFSNTCPLDDTTRVCVSVSVCVCVVCVHSVSLSLSRSLSNTNAAEEVEDTSLSCIEIGMYMIQ